MTWLLIAQLWVSSPDNTALLHGHWQSCLQLDGVWTEKIYDRYERSLLRWSFHMGPFDEFALFAPGTEPDEDDHSAPINLLTSPKVLSFNTKLRGRQWNIPQLQLWISIVEAGSSRLDCVAFHIRIEKLKRGVK